MGAIEWLRAIFALGATLALIGLAALAARRFNVLSSLQTGAVRRMNVVERLMLDPRRAIVIVRVDGLDRVVLLSPFGDRDLGATTAIPTSSDPQP
jgi:flagellar protein FliO/FliZ